MSLLNTSVKPFKATAFKQGKFIDVSDADLKGKWSVFFFYPADFTFVCPTELEDLADAYAGTRLNGSPRATYGARLPPAVEDRLLTRALVL